VGFVFIETGALLGVAALIEISAPVANRRFCSRVNDYLEVKKGLVKFCPFNVFKVVHF